MRLTIPALLSALLISAQAFALPNVQSESATQDDLTVTIRLFDRTIKGDSKSSCEIRVQDPGVQVPWQPKDKLDIWVYEDDLVGDELIWHKQIVIGSQTSIDETFDCSAAFPDGDASGALDIYGKAAADKAGCGLWPLCDDDDPSTKALTVEVVEDDDKEPDDDMGSAKNIGLGTSQGYIGRDQDWMAFQVVGSSAVNFKALHSPGLGRLDVAMYAPDGSQVATGADQGNATAIVDKVVPAGTYKVKVSPRSGNDYNFYDVLLTIGAVDCEPGASQQQACGNCGTQSRTCGADGTWPAWSACAGEGECGSGQTQSESCGKCGTRTRTCTVACSWVWGACEGEGVCTPGAKETQACTGGTQERECGVDCQWKPWGSCVVTGCTEGAKESCYEGPAGTEGVGVCKAGEKTCHSGTFGACEGQVKPGTESCANGLDDDCDGKTDKQDTVDCPEDAKGKIGAACGADAECEDGLRCLMPPTHAMFKGGYCGKVGCDSNADCGPGAICAHAYGYDYCLLECDSTNDCRVTAGYTCAHYDGDRGCTPKCKDNDDCVDAATPKCDTVFGVCVAEPGSEPVPEPKPEPTSEPVPETTGAEPQQDAIVVSDIKKDTGLPEGAIVITEGGGGCATGGAGAGPWWMILPALGLIPRRRR